MRIKEVTKEEISLLSKEESAKESKEDKETSQRGDEKQGKAIPLAKITPVKKQVKLSKQESNIKDKTISFFTDPYHLGLLIILLSTFFLRLKHIGQESIWNDAAVHLWYATRVTQEPLFALSTEYIFGDYFIPQSITAFLYLFTQDVFLAAKITSVLYALTGVLLMYLVTKEFIGKKAGLIASTLLAFHYLLWFYTVRPLADGPVTVMLLLILYCFTKAEKSKEKEQQAFWHILLGLSFLAAMLTKVQAAVFVFAIPIYAALIHKKEMIKKPQLFSWAIPLGTIFLGEILGRLIAGMSVLERLFGRIFLMRGMENGFEVLGFFPWVFSWYIIVLAILGLFFAYLYKRKEFLFPALLFFCYTIYFEVGVSSVDRYLLPLIPIAILFASFALREAEGYLALMSKNKTLATGALIFGIFLLCLSFYNIGDPLIEGRSNSYLGHQEAGEWLSFAMEEDAIVFAGSPRMVRAFSEQGYAGPDEFEEGGKVWNLRSERYTQDRSNFETDLVTLSQEHEVYLEIDIWEYTQASWYFPISQESINYFESLGFRIVHLVEREVPTPQGMTNTPVIIIFKLIEETEGLTSTEQLQEA